MLNNNDSNCALVVVAAGSGSRLGRGLPKAAVRLGGVTILEHCLLRARAALPMSTVVVVLPETSPGILHPELREVAESANARVVAGGATRDQSVRNALDALTGEEYVLIHDAARPFVPLAVFHRVLSELESGAKAVVPAVPVVDTIKEFRVSDSGTEVVAQSLSRAALRSVQTPQGFCRSSLRAAHALESTEELTDEAMAMEAAGFSVLLTQGAQESFKITTPMDLVLAEALLPLMASDGVTWRDRQ